MKSSSLSLHHSAGTSFLTERHDEAEHLPLLRHGEAYVAESGSKPAILLDESLPTIAPHKLTRRLF
jgi:hypothetical protein